MKKYIITLCIVCTVLVSVCIGVSLKKTKNVTQVDKNVAKCINNRACIEEQQTIKIGNNDKELKNGYYDILLERYDSGFTMYINKLWKDEFNESLLDNTYADEVAQFLTNRLKSSVNSLDILNCIIDGYTLAKNGEIYVNELRLEKEVVVFESKNYELVIEVRSI